MHQSACPRLEFAVLDLGCRNHGGLSELPEAGRSNCMVGWECGFRIWGIASKSENVREDVF